VKAWTSTATVLGIALGAGSSSAVAEECGLALVLAMDASKSMDSADFELAFDGTAAALRSAAVQAAILAQASPVALSAFEWSGQNHQRIVHDWTVLQSRQDIEEFASSLESHERGGIGQRTGTGSALQFAFAHLEEGPDCARKIVDLASDGYSSDGMTPREFYIGNLDLNVTVNALVIGGESRPHLWEYFNGEVLRGPGAFSLATIDYQDFPQAIAQKLLRELAPLRLSGVSGPRSLMQ
jgi:Ca-activated chloride channel homolog